MEKLELDKYFNEDQKEYDSIYLIMILVELLGKPFDEIKEDINNKKVTVTAEQIEAYLDQKFTEENPELKKRLAEPEPKISSNVAEWSHKDISDKARRFGDELEAARYYFEPYTLEYFIRYTDIVRNKIIKLLDIVSALSTGEIEPIKEILIDLDLNISKLGKVSRDDIVRIITPIIANINLLDDKLEKANDLSTYLTFKMSKHSLYRDGFSESEVYPMKSLQSKSRMNDFNDENVPLSEHQKRILKRHDAKNGKIIADILTRID